MSLIFVIVAILFVLPYRRVVNHKSNFVLCHSFSHICHSISSALHRPTNRSLLVTTFVLVIVFYLFTLFWDAQRCFICLPSSYLFCQLRNKNWRKKYCTNTYILIKDLRGNPKPRVSPDRTGPDRNRSGSGNIFKNIFGSGRVGEFYFGSVRVGEFYFGSVRVGVFFYGGMRHFLPGFRG